MPCNTLLDKLIDLLRAAGRVKLNPCIRDLVENGLEMDRFGPSDRVPNRQDVTQYLAAWCREAAIGEEDCRAWLSEYAVSMLSSISDSTAAAIRHSTKSNVKYIYKSQQPFFCGRKQNPFRAACSRSCPIYTEMEAKIATHELKKQSARQHSQRPPDPIIPAQSVKDCHREAFMSAIQFIDKELSAGTKKKHILEQLNERNMKTRTGQKWTLPTLYTEIRKIKLQTAYLRGHTP